MAWRGFVQESRDYMIHLPTWKFYLRLPKAWFRFTLLSLGIMK